MDLKEAIQNIGSVDNLKTVVEYYGVSLNKVGKEIKGCCPFHSEKTSSFKIHDKGNGAYYKCFGCGAGGDIANFVKKIEEKNGNSISMTEATKKAYDILGLKCDLKPSKLDDLKEYIEKNNPHHYKEKDYKFNDIYIYENEQNIPVLAKTKFKHPVTGKNIYSQANIIDAGDFYKLDNSNHKPNLLYNLPKVLKAIKENKDIFIVEGEKDANTLNKLGFVATTTREVSSTSEEILKPLFGGKVIAIGDNDETGTGHINNIRKILKKNVKSFRVLIFEDLIQLGNKSDISDLVEHYYSKELTKDNIRKIIKDKIDRTLDENNIYELQEDCIGIYKTVINKDSTENKNSKSYITNFKILKCEIIRSKDTKEQLIKLEIESNLGTKDIIEANARKLFSNLKTFRETLGIDYTFKGKDTDLQNLNEWILKYKANNIYEDVEQIENTNETNKLLIVNGDKYIESGIGQDKNFIVNGLVYEKSLGFIIAPPKVGKTTFSYLLARSIALGENFIEHEIPEKKNVLYVLVEGTLHSIINKFEAPSNMFILESKLFDWYKHKEMIINHIKQFNIEVVVLDSLYRLSDLDISKSIVLKPLLEQLDVLSTELGCTFIIPHHTNRMELTENHQNKVAGSSDIVRAGEFFIFLEKPKKTEEEEEEDFNLSNDEINQKPLNIIMSKHDYRYGKTGFNKYNIDIDLYNSKIKYSRFKLDGKKENKDDRLIDLINHAEAFLPIFKLEPNNGLFTKGKLTDILHDNYKTISKSTIQQHYIQDVIKHLEKNNLIVKDKGHYYKVVNNKKSKVLDLTQKQIEMNIKDA